jgi:hypothetical protein
VHADDLAIGPRADRAAGLGRGFLRLGGPVAQGHALHDQLLDLGVETACPGLDLGPKVVPPEGILAHRSLQRPHEKAKVRKALVAVHRAADGQGVAELTRDGQEADGRLRMEHMKDHARGTTLRPTEVALLRQDAVQPAKGPPCGSAKRPFRLGVWSSAGCALGDLEGVVVDLKERPDQRVDDIPVQLEDRLLFSATFILVIRAEANYGSASSSEIVVDGGPPYLQTVRSLRCIL